jgi:hypothetical protein
MLEGLLCKRIGILLEILVELKGGNAKWWLKTDSYSKSRLNRKFPTMQGLWCKNGWIFQNFELIL